MPTLAEKQAQYIQQLSTIYDSTEARTITQWVIEDVMQLSALKLSFNRFLILTSHQEDIFQSYLQRLMNYEPVQYVLGYTEFYGLRIGVSPAVLIPRPETEELVTWVLDEIKQYTQPHLLDIGTGSGCIPIAIKHHCIQARVDALDISSDALSIAQKNALTNQVAINFFQHDILTAELNDCYDLIVSNPPYIGYDEKQQMKENVLNHEPHLALFATDPLMFYKRIAELASAALKPAGVILVELSEYRVRETLAIFDSMGYQTTIKKDSRGKERMLKATR